MLRQVIVPSKENSTVSIPPEFFGSKVEILMFPSPNTEDSEKKKRIEEIRAIFDTMRCDLSGYKFDRDEANNYD